GARTISAARPDPPDLRGWHAVPEDGAAVRGKERGCRAVQWPILFRRTAWLPEDHRHDLYDRGDDQRRPGAGGHPALLPRPEEGSARPRSASGALHALLQERIPRSFPCNDGYQAVGSG